jgi:hypothetical protein
MIVMDIAGPGPELFCMAGLMPLILIIIIAFTGFKIYKKQENKSKLLSVIILGVTILIVSFYFLILHWKMIDRYYYYYDYFTALYVQMIVFSLIILIGFIISINILKKIRKGKRQIIMSILLSILLIIASIISAHYIETIDITEKDHEYIFQLTLETNETNSFVLYCPYMYKDDKIENIYSDDSKHGNFDIDIVSNKTGYKMIINGNGPVKIDYHYKGLDRFYFEDSLYYQWNNSAPFDLRNEYLIYYNSSNNDSSFLKIIWAYLGLGSEKHINLEGDLLVNGWQVIGGDKRNIAIA